MAPPREPPTAEQLAFYAAAFNANPALKLFGLVLDFPTADRIRVTLDPVREEQLGGLGTRAVNGAVLAAIFDLVLGASVALVDPTRRSATMQLSMSFERPVRGSRLTAEAWVDRAGRTTVFSSGVIKDEKGEVCSRAQGVMWISTEPWTGEALIPVG